MDGWMLEYMEVTLFSETPSPHHLKAYVWGHEVAILPVR